MKQIKLALDWAPNINHIGFLVSHELGFYKEKGVDIKIISPDSDDYKYTPAKKIELGQADLGLCPTESLISYRTKKSPFKLIALATIFQEDVSAIAVKSGSNIKSPKDLDNKSYASYGARYEDQIIKKMIINDGGLGKINIFYPERLGVWESILKGKYDSTWIFLNWEGIEKPEFSFFKMKDYGIPYSYSPLIVASENYLKNNEIGLRNFLKATKKGFMYALENSKHSTDILLKHIPHNDKNISLLKSLNFSKKYFGDEKNFGKIKLDVFKEFFYWINTHGIERHKLDVNNLFYEIDF